MGLADCLKDLQRFLRHDDPVTREAFMHLGRQNIVKSDLIPLIMQYVEEMDIVYNACTTLDHVAHTSSVVSRREDSHTSIFSIARAFE